MLTIHPIETIVSDPAIRGGRLIIAGTRVALIDVISSYHSGRSDSPEEIARNYGLSLGQVFAALAYYYDHQADVEAELSRQRADAQAALSAIRDQGTLIELE